MLPGECLGDVYGPSRSLIFVFVIACVCSDIMGLYLDGDARTISCKSACTSKGSKHAQAIDLEQNP